MWAIKVITFLPLLLMGAFICYALIEIFNHYVGVSKIDDIEPPDNKEMH